MSLAVIGVTQRSLPVAAVASAVSGEKVVVAGNDAPVSVDMPVMGSGISGRAHVETASPDDLAGATAFVVAVTAANLRSTLEQYAEAVKGKPVLLAPGGFAGALMAAQQFPELAEAGTIFCEAPGWMFGGRVVGDHIRIAMRKHNLEVAAAEDTHTSHAVELFGRYFLDLIPSDLVTTSMSNINAIIHPPLAITNATRISQAEDWHLWDEGFTVEVERLISAIDLERVRIVERLGGNPEPLLALALTAYGPAGMSGDNYFDAVKSFEVYRGRPGEKRIDGPFLVDDVAFGVAAYEALAQELGLDHAVLTSVRTLAEIVLGRSLRADTAAVSALMRYASQRQPQPTAG